MSQQGAIQLLQRYRIARPGTLEAWGSYRSYGAIFAGAALVMGAFPVLALVNHRGSDGLWVVVGFLALFALAGVYIAGFWGRLQVDPEGIAYASGSWFGKTTHRAPRTALERVRLIRQVVRSGHSTRTRYVPQLVFRAPGFPEVLQIGASRREADARKAAEEMARALELPFEDALGDEPIVRDPEALDVPTFRREASSEPVPRNVLPGWERGNEVRLRGTLRPGGATLAIGAGLMMLVFSLGALGLLLGWARDGRALVIAAPIVGPGLFFIAWGVVSTLAREHIVVRPDAVVRSRHLGPLVWGRCTVPRAEIESLRVQTKGRYGLAVVTDRRTWILGPSLDASGLHWLSSWLNRHLA